MTRLKKRPRPEEPCLPTCNTCAAFTRELEENLSGGVKGLSTTCVSNPNAIVWPDKPGCMFHDEFDQILKDENLGSFEPNISIPTITDQDVINAIHPLQDAITTLWGVNGAMVIDYALKTHGWVVAQLFQSLNSLLLNNFAEMITHHFQGLLERQKQEIARYVEYSMASMRKEVREALATTEEEEDDGIRED